ncbi:MAG: hypothetical protein NZ805_08895 [Armatimonadetes bacterium]|nr:hypothetical protein [Armatimonadota bacterium]
MSNLEMMLQKPVLSRSEAQKLMEDFERFRFEPLPRPIWEYVLERYKIDLRSKYADFPVSLPFGKASGQLSLNPHQVRKDAEVGLGFCVLKTLVAQDADGNQSMRDWAVPVTRMKLEPIKGQDGTEGWTVTWAGRGWHKSFEDYLRFFDEALSIGAEHEMLVVPSIIAYLPPYPDEEWRVGEYDFTVGELLKVWRKHNPNLPMPIEFNFSPTLAGSESARWQGPILNWLVNVPRLIKEAAEKATGIESRKVIRVGIKLFNALFDDIFQLRMLRTLLKEAAKGKGADFIVYANRLFDPNREYEGVKGVAYGGPDLSARNLKVLLELTKAWRRDELATWLPLSGTGNICNGEIAFKYLLCGCSTLQIHTFFQLPNYCYAKRAGSKIERALHQLLFEPENGFIAWLLWAMRWSCTCFGPFEVFYLTVRK